MDNSYNPFDLILNKLSHIEAKMSSNHSLSEEPLYLKVDKAAEFLSTSANALRMMVHKNQIPYIKKQNKVYFLRSDLITWFESGRISSEEIIAEENLIGNKKRL